MEISEASDLTHEPLLPPAVWRSFRDGGVLLLGVFLGGLAIRIEHGDLFFHCFLWVPFAFFVFPTGAALGWFLPRWVARRGWPATLGLGLLLGLLVGLGFAAIIWTILNSNDLLGLVTNRHGGGYESYSFSVKKGLWESAGRIFTRVPPLGLVWITFWTLWKKVFASNALPMESAAPARLLGGKRLLLAWGAIAVGMGLYASLVVAIGVVFTRGMGDSVKSLLIAGPAGAGLVVLGPFLGPIFNPGADHTALAWRCTAFAAPVWIASILPFVFCRRLLSPGATAAAWVGWVSAIWVWVFLGFGVLLHCAS